MKINQKFAKKAIIAATLTSGIIGFNSIFNEAQASTRINLLWNGNHCYVHRLGNCGAY